MCRICRMCKICRICRLIKAVNAWVRSAFGNVSFEYILGEFDRGFIFSSSKTIEGFLLLTCFLVQRLIFSTSRQSFGFADTSCLLGIRCQRSSNLEVRQLVYRVFIVLLKANSGIKSSTLSAFYLLGCPSRKSPCEQQRPNGLCTHHSW